MLTTFILIIAPNCSDEMVETLKHDLSYNNTGYERFISQDYEVICMGGVSLHSIESVTVPLLRQVLPSNPLVFVYGTQYEWDYQLYISGKYGSQYYMLVAGNADVERGYAVASLNHITIQHERAHLEMCAAHTRDSDPYDPVTWIRTMDRPWCPSRS